MVYSDIPESLVLWNSSPWMDRACELWLGSLTEEVTTSENGIVVRSLCKGAATGKQAETGGTPVIRRPWNGRWLQVR